MSLPSWSGSRGRGRRCIAMPPSMARGANGSTRNRLGRYSARFKLDHYPPATLLASAAKVLGGRDKPGHDTRSGAACRHPSRARACGTAPGRHFLAVVGLRAGA
jgi:hypothetical protein